jgi:hypothetical protein
MAMNQTPLDMASDRAVTSFLSQSMNTSPGTSNWSTKSNNILNQPTKSAPKHCAAPDLAHVEKMWNPPTTSKLQCTLHQKMDRLTLSVHYLTMVLTSMKGTTIAGLHWLWHQGMETQGGRIVD